MALQRQPSSTPSASVKRSSFGSCRRWKLSIRLRANSSACSVAASQAFIAASTSPAPTRRPLASRSSRSNFFVASSSAASPRAATSSTMARAACSISAETSRFIARKLANRSVKSARLRSRRTGMAAFRAGALISEPTAQWRGGQLASTLCYLGFSVIPGWSEGPDPESRDSGFALRAPRNDVSTSNARRSRTLPRPPGILTIVRGPEIVGAEVGQLAFQAFDVEPQRAAMVEHQDRAAAGGVARMKFDAEQFQRGFRLSEVDIARLARQHPVEAQRRDQAARRGFAGHGLFPVQPAHADHQAFLALTPDDVGGLDVGVLDMRRDHGEVVGIERDQFELRRHRSLRKSYPLMRSMVAPQADNLSSSRSK